jgi:hypothetical protein
VGIVRVAYAFFAEVDTECYMIVCRVVGIVRNVVVVDIYDYAVVRGVAVEAALFQSKIVFFLCHIRLARILAFVIDVLGKFFVNRYFGFE